MIEAPKNILIKYVSPTKYDIAPVKTIWKVMNQDKYELFIQINEDVQNPHWEKIGNFLEKAFTQMLENKIFVSECYRLYMYLEDSPQHKINALLQDKKKYS